MFSNPQQAPHHYPDQATHPGSDPDLGAAATPPADAHTGHRGHGLMMLVCCIPVVLLAVALIATGRFSLGALLPALACMAMMGVMMLVMRKPPAPLTSRPPPSRPAQPPHPRGRLGRLLTRPDLSLDEEPP